MSHAHAADMPASEAPRLAQLMGLSKWREMSDMALVRRVETGLPLSAVERVARYIDPEDRTAVYELVSKATWSRLRRKPNPHLTRDMSERLYGVARVIDEGLRLWRGDAPAVARFLRRPHSLLDGRTPLDVARESTVGADMVVKILGEARAGVAL